MKIGIALTGMFGGILSILILSTILGYGYVWGLSAFFWFFGSLLIVLYGIKRIVNARRKEKTQ